MSLRTTEGAAHAVAEQREPIDGLVAEHEAHVAIGDLAAPSTHRSGGDLLGEQTVGNLRTVEPKRRHVEEERPAPGGAYHGKPVELAKRLVSTLRPLGVPGGQGVDG